LEEKPAKFSVTLKILNFTGKLVGAAAVSSAVKVRQRIGAKTIAMLRGENLIRGIFI
jgi:hypothetical protein